MSGMSGIFNLKAADVYKVKSLKALGSWYCFPQP
jgi:hypothetical protein